MRCSRFLPGTEDRRIAVGNDQVMDIPPPLGCPPFKGITVNARLKSVSIVRFLSIVLSNSVCLSDRLLYLGLEDSSFLRRVSERPRLPPLPKRRFCLALRFRDQG